jgi:cytochrome P450
MERGRQHRWKGASTGSRPAHPGTDRESSITSLDRDGYSSTGLCLEHGNGLAQGNRGRPKAVRRQAIRAGLPLIPNAAEEVMRLDSSVISWRGRATNATELDGVSIPAGANLLLLPGSGDREPVRICGSGLLRHPAPEHKHDLPFGHGAHLCLGRQLARLQTEIALEELSARFPTCGCSRPWIWSSRRTHRSAALCRCP